MTEKNDSCLKELLGILFEKSIPKKENEQKETKKGKEENEDDIQILVVMKNLTMIMMKVMEMLNLVKAMIKKRMMKEKQRTVFPKKKKINKKTVRKIKESQKKNSLQMKNILI